MNEPWSSYVNLFANAVKPANRAGFISKCIAFLEQWGFDGCDGWLAGWLAGLGRTACCIGWVAGWLAVKTSWQLGHARVAVFLEHARWLPASGRQGRWAGMAPAWHPHPGPPGCLR